MTRLFPKAEKRRSRSIAAPAFYAVQIFGWPHVGQKRVFASRVAPQVGQIQLVGAYRVTGEPQFGQNVYPLSTAAPQVWQIVADSAGLACAAGAPQWEQKRSDGSRLLPQDAQVRAGAEGRA